MKKTDSNIFFGEAPGRLDVMGGIADYSGSLVLQMPIKQKASVKLTLRYDHILTITSNQFPDEHFSIQLDSLIENGKIDYKSIQLRLKQTKNGTWASYIVGCILVLMAEQNIEFCGADIELQSDVPLGKGVSSSAAIEMATLKALKNAYELNIDEALLPLYGQKAENLIVGAPCGLMDQLTSFYGKKGHLLPILCQPDKLFPLVEIPRDIHFIGFDSGVKHNVSGDLYSNVRTAAFMGYTIIALECGCTFNDIKRAYDTGDFSGLPYNGYLSNINTDDFEQNFVSLLPEKMYGKEFVKKYGGIVDTVSEIKDETEYAVKACTAHPIYENNRINHFLRTLKNIEIYPAKKFVFLQELGTLMNQSHKSYSACGLGHANTDDIVDLISHQGYSSGVFGGRITGGGSGGTVCVLTNGEIGLQTLGKIKTLYENKLQKNIALIY